jgi:hypothetical protein
MFHDFNMNLVLSLLHSTLIDTVTGTLSYLNPKDEPLGRVHVFFYGIMKVTTTDWNSSNTKTSKMTQRHVLFLYKRIEYTSTVPLDKNVLHK